MHQAVLVMLLVGGSVLLAGIARSRGWSAPILLVIAGLFVSFIPGLPEYDLEPEIILVLVLPPLLFSAALGGSYLNFRRNAEPIASLSVGLVLFTTLLVAVIAHTFIPNMPLAAAFALGAIVAPPDAVAATAIGRHLGLPRRLLVILAGESLINDATALTTYRVAVHAAVSDRFSVLTSALQLVYAASAGLVFGYLVAVMVRWVTDRLRDATLANTVWMLTPFIAFLPMERLQASGVLAVVVAGLYLGHHAPHSAGYATRLDAQTLWQMISFLLESTVFALIGLQLRTVLNSLPHLSFADLAGAASLVVGVVVLCRPAWIFLSTYLVRRVFPRFAARDPAPPWQLPAVLSWAGMRGVVSMVAAFGLPHTIDSGAPFPQRNLIIFITMCVVIATLVIQGLTLPIVIRKLGVVATESAQDRLAEAGAQEAAAQAALRHLDSLVAKEGGADIPENVIRLLRERAEIRSFAAWERLGRERPGYVETPSALYRRIRIEMLDVERGAFVEMRDAGRIDDEVLRRVQRELDLEEAMLARE